MNSFGNCGKRTSSPIEEKVRFLYGGNSMRFLFAAGDVLMARPIAFDEVRKGDVIVFQQAGKAIVHRVRRRSQEELVTMGDNNARCDRRPLTRNDQLFLVESRITRNRKPVPVRRGRRGMVRFAGNRLLRFMLRILAAGGRRIIRFTDWRRPLPEPERFGGEFCYVVRGRMVAWKSFRNGAVQYARLSDRLKYRSK